MAKLTRKTLRPFGDSASTSYIGQFGSKLAGVPQTSKDPTVIQQLSAWVNGWQLAISGSDKAPYLQDMNGIMYVFCYMLSYLFQTGIPEWDSGTTYFIDSVVQDAGGSGQQFKSLQDNNTGNTPPSGASNAYWLWINPPAVLVGASSTVNKIQKVSTLSPASGVPGSTAVTDSLLSDDGTDVILGGTPGTNALKFPDGTRQLTASTGSVASQGVVTGSRALSTVFQNTGTKPLFVSVCSVLAYGGGVDVYVDASATPTTLVAALGGVSMSAGVYQMFFIVLPGYYYKAAGTGAAVSVWTEWA